MVAGRRHVLGHLDGGKGQREAIVPAGVDVAEAGVARDPDRTPVPVAVYRELNVAALVARAVDLGQVQEDVEADLTREREPIGLELGLGSGIFVYGGDGCVVRGDDIAHLHVFGFFPADLHAPMREFLARWGREAAAGQGVGLANAERYGIHAAAGSIASLVEVDVHTLLAAALAVLTTPVVYGRDTSLDHALAILWKTDSLAVYLDLGVARKEIAKLLIEINMSGVMVAGARDRSCLKTAFMVEPLSSVNEWPSLTSSPST